MIKNTHSQVDAWPMQKEQLTDLILAPDGRIYLSPSFDDAADWSCVYYDGNVCIHQDGNMYCLGSLPVKCRWLPMFAGYTHLCEPEENCCFLFSECPVLGDAAAVFSVFRYGDTIALYMADSVVSRGIYFALMEYTPEDEVLYGKLFRQMVSRHDPEAAEKVAAWLKRHAVKGKEV